MARRRTKKTTRRSTPKKTNLLNVAQSVILGNAVTEGLFNTNMYEFVTGRINGNFTPGAFAQSSQITLPELLGAGFGNREMINAGSGTGFGVTYATSGYGGVHGSFADAVKSNLQANGIQMMTTLVVTPIAFKVISKLAKKPRSEFNKLARSVGLPVSM
jgi:hypothetical protein